MVQRLLVVAGRINIDYIVRLDHELRLHSKNVGKGFEKLFGGSGANVAIAAAKILGKERVFMVGAVGDDEDGRLCIDNLAKHGVSTRFVKIVRGVPTGRALVILDPSGRATIVSIPGANAIVGLDDEDIKELRSLRPRVVTITNPPTHVARRLIELVIDVRSTLVIDPGRTFLPLELLDLVKQVDSCYIVPNEEELLEMFPSESVEQSLAQAARITGCNVIAKRGANGVEAIIGGKLVKCNALPIEVLGMRTTSTVGCGDTLTGVLSAYLYLGIDPVEALSLAIVAASLKSARIGAQECPNREEIEKVYELSKARNLLKLEILST